MIRNPFSSDGSFSLTDMVQELEGDLARKRISLDTLVRRGNMRKVNADARIGAIEALLEKTRAEMLRERGITLRRKIEFRRLSNSEIRRI
jgi:hypothetical protein